MFGLNTKVQADSEENAIGYSSLYIEAGTSLTCELSKCSISRIQIRLMTSGTLRQYFIYLRYDSHVTPAANLLNKIYNNNNNYTAVSVFFNNKLQKTTMKGGKTVLLHIVCSSEDLA